MEGWIVDGWKAEVGKRGNVRTTHHRTLSPSIPYVF